MDTDTTRDAIRNAIGNEIRAARARRGYYTDELADQSGLSHTTIVVSSREETVDRVQLFAICQVLDVDPGVLLDAAQSAQGCRGELTRGAGACSLGDDFVNVRYCHVDPPRSNKYSNDKGKPDQRQHLANDAP
ncbi:helix-turn-helix domain-containing protein [Rhodococcus hoagii]|nr:helix-turn-helix domain-containing protein [Prescottella equi]